MNVINLLTANVVPVLLIGGVALLVFNVIYGFVRARREKVQAGWFTVAVALAACIFIGMGAYQAAAAVTAANSPVARFAGPGAGARPGFGGAATTQAPTANAASGQQSA